MSANLRATLASFAIFVAFPLVADDLPPAPEGFAWKRIESVKASFLVPRCWFVREEDQGGTRAIFISKQSTQEGGRFTTGLTVNVQKAPHGSAQDRARKAITQFGRLGEIQKLWEAENGALKLYGARIHVTKDSPPFTEQVLAIGNSRTDALYEIFFESPDPLWDEAWKTGEVMLKDFFLDDEY